MSESAYEEETEFEEVLASDDVSSIGNGHSDSHFDATPIASSKKRRGKGLLWEEFIFVETGDFVTYSCLDDVKQDVAKEGYSKMCSSPPFLQYRCKHRYCDYKRKYEINVVLGKYISYFQ